MNIEFIIKQNDKTVLDNRVHFDEKSQFLMTTNVDESVSGAALLFYADTELMVDVNTNKIIAFEGYEPPEYWVKSANNMPAISLGLPVVDPSLELKPGVGYEIGDRRQKANYDAKTKILLVGPAAKEVYRVLDNLYIGIQSSKLCSLYITDLNI
jgi:hypothetical protein